MRCLSHYNRCLRYGGETQKWKAAGWAKMSNEHLFYLQQDVWSIIAVMINSMLNHGAVPFFQMTLHLHCNGLDKGHKSHAWWQSSYRAVTLSTILSKVLELILIDRPQPSGWQWSSGCLQDVLSPTECNFGLTMGTWPHRAQQVDIERSPADREPLGST